MSLLGGNLFKKIDKKIRMNVTVHNIFSFKNQNDIQNSYKLKIRFFNLGLYILWIPPKDKSNG